MSKLFQVMVQSVLTKKPHPFRNVNKPEFLRQIIGVYLAMTFVI